MDKKQSRMKRALRLRSKIKSLSATRLSIHKTPLHIYAQVISIPTIPTTMSLTNNFSPFQRGRFALRVN